MSDFLLYSLVRLASAVVRVLPLGFSLALARGAGALYYVVAGKRNRRALANLKIAFPDKTADGRKRIVREMYKRFAQNLVETLYAPALDERFIGDHVRITNIGCAEEALRQGKGVIFLGCHAGSWEVSNIACAMLFRGSAYAMLAHPQARTPRLDAFLNRVREGKGCHVLRVDELK